MNKKSIPKLLKTLNEYFFHSGSLSDGEIGELVANAKLEYDFLMESPRTPMNDMTREEAEKLISKWQEDEHFSTGQLLDALGYPPPVDELAAAVEEYVKSKQLFADRVEKKQMFDIDIDDLNEFIDECDAMQAAYEKRIRELEARLTAPEPEELVEARKDLMKAYLVKRITDNDWSNYYSALKDCYDKLEKAYEALRRPQ